MYNVYGMHAMCMYVMHICSMYYVCMIWGSG